MLLRPGKRWLATLLCTTATASSILPRAEVDEVSGDMCALYKTRIAVAANTLYFMGGAYMFATAVGAYSGPYDNPAMCSMKAYGDEGRDLYSIPLNTSFSINGPLASNDFSRVDARRQFEKQGAFFQDADETMLYSLAGYSGPTQPTNELTAYNITSGEWSEISVAGGDFNFDPRTQMSSAVTRGSSAGLGFALGGHDDVGGMIRFDAQDPSKPRWQNETDNAPPLTYAGRMEHIRLGSQGSLVNFGGYDKDVGHLDLQGRVSSLRAMSVINVYDINSGAWYNVTAGGDIPDDRSFFCTAVSSAPDDSSFQITVYGGWDRVANYSFADTYVLSIPSFQWINVTDDFNSDAHIFNGLARSGRHDHQCTSYKDREMLVLGGRITRDGEKVNSRHCFGNYPALRALDLSTFKWMDTWEADPEDYFVPDAVTRIIGGDRNGSAAMRQPPGGFREPTLSSLFAQVAPRYTSSGIPTEPDHGGGDLSDDPRSDVAPEPSSNTSAGTIAGATVGAVIFVSIIMATIWLMRRRRTRRNRGIQITAPTDHLPSELQSNSECVMNNPGRVPYSPASYHSRFLSSGTDTGSPGEEAGAAPHRGHGKGIGPTELPS